MSICSCITLCSKALLHWMIVILWTRVVKMQCQVKAGSIVGGKAYYFSFLNTLFVRVRGQVKENTFNIVGAISNFIRPSTSWAIEGRSSSDVFNMALADPKCGVSVGCHPHYVSSPFYTNGMLITTFQAHEFKATEILRMESLLKQDSSQVISIGEIGLDFSYKNSNL